MTSMNDDPMLDDTNYFTENEYYGYSGHDEGHPSGNRFVGSYDPVKAEAKFRQQLKDMHDKHITDLKRLREIYEN